MSSSRHAVCTICSKNYLHFARTLMASVARVHPDWDRFVLLVDRVDDAFDPDAEPFEVHSQAWVTISVGSILGKVHIP